MNKEFERWLDKCEDAELRLALDNVGEDELKRYFSAGLEFGTAGLRGIMTAGCGAMNIYTVRQATRGLGEYMLESGCDKSVVIAHDTRINSRLFAKESARVLAAMGIKTLLFDGARPTPELSFAVRELKCGAGINVTASHNPKEYNGYKVYHSDGAQIGEAQANAISARIKAVDCFDIPLADFEYAVCDGLIETIGSGFDDLYMDKVLGQSVNGGVDKSLRIVYTPLHGAGAAIAPRLLERAGYTGVDTVAEQLAPDGTFPTAKKPNPEFAEAFELGIALAEKTSASLVLANDPDADRAGAAVREKDGSFTILSGNRIGALLLEYVLSAYKETDTMPNAPFAVKSIVSTRLADRVCAAYGAAIRNVPTGFKYIGEQIEKSMTEGGSYVFGFEESNGYLTGTYARDKDGILAVMLLCEAAAYYGGKGMTLSDALGAMDEKYGYFREYTENLVETGADAKAVIDGKMKRLRTTPPSEIAGKAVKLVDYNTDDSPIGKVNMLSFVFEDGCEIMVRPSGTEPKMKMYIHVNAPTADEAEAKAQALRSAAREM